LKLLGSALNRLDLKLVKILW